MIQAEIKTTIEFSEPVFSNLIICALEGGSNYWYWLPSDEVKKINQYYKHLHPTSEKEPLASKIAQCIFHTDIRITITDMESPDDVLGYIDGKRCINALIKMYEDYHEHYLDAINGNDDAVTADIFFQLAVLGNLTFG